jgi:hypothetical protein
MLASQPFDPHKWPPISNREPFVRRLRLIEILGAIITCLPNFLLDGVYDVRVV